MWLQHLNFFSLIQNFWDSHQAAGCPMFVLATKLRALNPMLKSGTSMSLETLINRLDGLHRSLSSCVWFGDHPTDPEPNYQIILSLHFKSAFTIDHNILNTRVGGASYS
ncbi:hypothetical protein M0R45_008582 [Rubus argutus]|uniref:Uncharacterized protein n=1 Tax=Rubus argutus TaxID=59490 RepID=A0AAW1Y354_RUBAR